MDPQDIDFFRLQSFRSAPIALSADGDPAPALFFYGTLMVPHVLYRVIYGTPQPAEKTICKILARPALLQNYQRRRRRNAAYPGIIPKQGSEVRGTYVEGLTKADLRRLGLFEGSEYALKQASVKVLTRKDGKETWEEKQVHTYVYVAPESCLEDKEWIFEDFLKEKAHDWAGTNREESLVSSDVDPQLGWYKDPDQAQVAEVHTQAE